MKEIKNICNMITPIVRVEVEGIDANVYIKRDDLLPFSFGGNKVRIVEEYFKDMVKAGGNCIIGYGSPQSNLCRVLANLSCCHNIPCHIITSLDSTDEKIITNNNRLVNICGAISHTCKKDNVADTVQYVMNQCCEMGLSPYYIYGNCLGKGNEAVPVRAYVKAYEEIKCQQEQMKLQFDYIFLATGTGMTQAGLIAGKMQYGGMERIIGISVAREANNEKEVIKGYINAYMNDRCMEYAVSDIDVNDRYLCGGYSQYNEKIKDVIWEMYKMNGIPMDSTYTGKAFWGMKEYINEKKLVGKNVLFIHTGGMPLFFDFLG